MINILQNWQVAKTDYYDFEDAKKLRDKKPGNMLTTMIHP